MNDPLQDPRFFVDPYPTYARLRNAAPVQKVPTGSGGRYSFVVTGYAEAREAFTDPRLSKNTARFFAGRPSQRDLHPAVSQNMLATDPPQHARLRGLVTKAFTTGAVARLRPYITGLVDELLDAWPDHGPVDLVESLAVPLPVTVICEMLGVPEADRRLVRTWSGDLFAAGDSTRIDAASHAVAGYMTDLVTARRGSPGESLLDDLIAVRDGQDKLTEDELVSLAVLLLVAGHETTTNFIGNAALALLQHPESLARLRAEPQLLGNALDELLRFDSPVGIATFRYSTEALTLGGTVIPEGVPVLIAPGAANRDPDRFPAPDQLDLDRGASGHLAFGHGIHRCLGAPLARAEGELALRAVISRFPDVRLAVPAEELDWRHTRLMRGLTTLPLIV
ncbi:cytochrome [Streptomyces agglomeratus]|uniref:Cytochrome n=1 Tax=Streptomyces agglomeratus TaxID=285458 RepID=A0A1E5P8G2_9ACTN|nr:cytochrome P450 [Streptomyces agglomeratus]OEJ25829.1 cytochrome [Streptomyces agglomeratus]OEJ40114.1 cytochrome [Streptomyces agglomeratus]OEJ45506.1 cytochrome [Streptomyces agglomeratus]OEJ52677.1 cytochrome [Streptomyces agglomeratus]